ncbi:MAG: hypothetical protein AVDCRST_MAG93-9695 [uncultured Chloroflexia bacterium]|uniref:Uncharacterized protein n=1 Tax=uncultured Chloroflexia bacterium TaxID=1672391 RepID=A0A6J4NKB6_9CHLR|nr:MAG: hypothetical protein AVDCRST_MAG93-9695 [uncultured Chloroflexia bacterium]
MYYAALMAVSGVNGTVGFRAVQLVTLPFVRFAQAD